jgi:hypothetical protein
MEANFLMRKGNALGSLASGLQGAMNRLPRFVAPAMMRVWLIPRWLQSLSLPPIRFRNAIAVLRRAEEARFDTGLQCF